MWLFKLDPAHSAHPQAQGPILSLNAKLTHLWPSLHIFTPNRKTFNKYGEHSEKVGGGEGTFPSGKGF